MFGPQRSSRQCRVSLTADIRPSDLAAARLAGPPAKTDTELELMIRHSTAYLKTTPVSAAFLENPVRLPVSPTQSPSRSNRSHEFMALLQSGVTGLDSDGIWMLAQDPFAKDSRKLTNGSKSSARFFRRMRRFPVMLQNTM